MARIKHHHRGRMVYGLFTLLPVLFLTWRAATRLGERPSFADLGSLGFLAILAGIGLVQLLGLANLTIDPQTRTYVCWWGPFVPLWSVSGYLGDIIGLTVKTSSRWSPIGDRRHGVYLNSRIAKPIRIEAESTFEQAQQAATWLANDLQTQVLDPADPGTPLGL